MDFFLPFHYDFFRIIFYNIASFPLLLISRKNSLLNFFRFKYKITFKLELTLKIVRLYVCRYLPEKERPLPMMRHLEWKEFS